MKIELDRNKERKIKASQQKFTAELMNLTGRENMIFNCMHVYIL